MGTPPAERSPLTRQLIRKSEALRFILADNPASSLDPEAENSFSYGRATLERLLSGAKDEVAMWYYQKGGTARWWAVAGPADLGREGMFALSTRYASYSPHLGLRLRPAGDGNAPSAGMRAGPRVSHWQPVVAERYTSSGCPTEQDTHRDTYR